MGILSRHDEPGSIFRSVILGEDSGPGRSVLGTVKAVAIAIGGLAGVTAASAGISALRKREEKAKGNS